MLRQRLVLVIAAAMIGFLPAHSTPGKAVVVRTCLTRGHIIARPLCPGVCIRPVCRKRVCVVRPRRRVVITSPFVRRFVRLWPRRRVVVVRPPHVKHVVVEPSPTVTAPVAVAEPSAVTVWITNSNWPLRGELAHRRQAWAGEASSMQIATSLHCQHTRSR